MKKYIWFAFLLMLAVFLPSSCTNSAPEKATAPETAPTTESAKPVQQDTTAAEAAKTKDSKAEKADDDDD